MVEERCSAIFLVFIVTPRPDIPPSWPPTQAAAVGLMFLCTMAGDVAAADLSMFSELILGGTSSQMVEYLMAGFWILLRCAVGAASEVET